MTCRTELLRAEETKLYLTDGPWSYYTSWYGPLAYLIPLRFQIVVLHGLRGRGRAVGHAIDVAIR